ncbi:MAG TPA: hypothetical protein VN665_00580 [Candidatus Paceibacterota bacterium]|nr:hypothetical protein [Candidatus Paceibacterota bacterium]
MIAEAPIDQISSGPATSRSIMLLTMLLKKIALWAAKAHVLRFIIEGVSLSWRKINHPDANDRAAGTQQYT